MTEGRDDAGARQAASGRPDSPVAALAGRLAAEAASVNEELSEIELMISHARAEAARHEGKRAAVSDRLMQRPPASTAEGKELGDLAKQVALLTRRAAVMEAQIDVLEGKQRALTRYRDATAQLAAEVAALAATAGGAAPVVVASDAAGPSIEDDGASFGSARSVLGAQEELRRQIARSLHDGPVQGLTNIALQAQIVERLVSRSPEEAAKEAQGLVAMVQSTLDVTKSFLFDVRPMVLDDLGLVPTLRRTVRERARTTDVTVELDSTGQDLRLSGEVESSLFRIIDDGLTAYLATGADRVSVRLDWMDRLSIVIAASREPGIGEDQEIAAPAADVPPALVAMIEDRRLARRPHIAAETWREIRARAATIGAIVELYDEGSELRASVPIVGRP